METSYSVYPSSLFPVPTYLNITILFVHLFCFAECAQTSHVMGDVPEKPICCKNGNFRRIQCRRGMCRCVDADGRQTEQESADVAQLRCYTPEWKTC